mgnify:FL=1
MDSKCPGDLVYILGTTLNELGASEYYAHLGYTGLNGPRVDPQRFWAYYAALQDAIENELAASVHGVYRGGLGSHLALVAMGGRLGMQVNLAGVPADDILGDDIILFSETAGRFIVTIDPADKDRFEQFFADQPCARIGQVTEEPVFTVSGIDNRTIISLPVAELLTAWKKPFGSLT